MKRFSWLIWVVLLSVFTFIPLLVSGYFPMHDDLQIGRLYQLDLCFRDGQIPCRWVPDMGYGYGYPLFNYYPVFPYYLAELFHLGGASLINSIKIVFILGFVFSGIFAFLLGRELWGDWGGLVTAAFYLFAPYHAVDVYVRGALAEFWGLVFFPAVFWAVYKLVKEEKVINLISLAVFYGFLLLSHNLMAFFFTPVVVGWGLFLLWYFKKSWSVLIRLALAGVWGIGLAAFFVLPVIFEKRFVHIETMFIGYFNYLAHFATFRQLFLSRFWGYGPSTWGPEDGMAFPLGQLHWLLAVVSILLFGFLWLRKKKRDFWLVAFCFFFFVFSAFLAHLRSTPLWQAIPVLAYMQFPWRFVGIASFLATILAGSVFILIKNKSQAVVLAVVMILAVVVFNLPFFHPERILKISDQEKLFSAKGWRKLQTDAIFDYLPIFAERPPAGPAPAKPWLEEGEGEISHFQKGTQWQRFSINISSEKAVIRLPLYDFPGWRVWVDGKKVATNHDNELGLITFTVGQGRHQIEVRLVNTLVRTLANGLSLFSWLCLLGVILRLSRQRFSWKTTRK